MFTYDTKLTYGYREESRQKSLPESCKEYYLFLLEFYVKEVSGSRLAKFNQTFFVPTSVRFEFLDFMDDDDLQVTPVDPLFQPQAGIANDVEVFNVGKSVLCAVDFATVTDRSLKMILKIIVKKRLPGNINVNLDDIVVGTGELDLSDQYAALRLEMLQCWRQDITSKTFEGQVPLIHETDPTGKLDVFVRMSSYGQTIVTDFNAPVPQDSKTFVFGAEEVDQTYKFRKVEPCAGDLFRDSSKDLQSSIRCPVCLPERYPCIPCGKMAAVEKRDEKIRDARMDTAIEKKSKYTTSKSLLQSSYGLSELCGKPVVLKVSGLFDNEDGKKPTVTIADESAAAKPGNLSDPDHDVFILRIGKKGLVGIGEKSDIQLEMKTPKGPEKRPPIRYETREMQTDDKEEEVKKVKDKKQKRKKQKKK